MDLWQKTKYTSRSEGKNHCLEHRDITCNFVKNNKAVMNIMREKKLQVIITAILSIAMLITATSLPAM